MSARDRMLALIRARQGKPAARTQDESAAVQAYVSGRARSPVPRDDGDRLARFRERALSLASTVDAVAALGDVPGAVAAYLRERQLALRAVCWRQLFELDWAGHGIAIEARAARDDDLVGITSAFCAIAETGTLLTLSGADTPPSVSLLPETHIAVFNASRIVRHMEDAWELVRTENTGLPRAVNFISGPSRTADIEQTVTLGAHGPYRVHIVLVGA
jgi:L-lactate dehydrogenase complex protein LldG